MTGIILLTSRSLYHLKSQLLGIISAFSHIPTATRAILHALLKHDYFTVTEKTWCILVRIQLFHVHVDHCCLSQRSTLSTIDHCLPLVQNPRFDYGPFIASSTGNLRPMVVSGATFIRTAGGRVSDAR
jgi:hypothetical protein